MIKAPTTSEKQEIDEKAFVQVMTFLQSYYSQQVSLQNFTASAMKRVGETIIVTGLNTIFAQHPLFLPMKWFGGWAAKKIGKSLVAPSTIQQVESACAISAAESQPSEKNVVRPVHYDERPMGKVKTIVVTLTGEVKTLLLEVTPQDIAKETLAVMGSAAMSTALIFVAGPPGWIGIPAYLLVEGGTKSISSFLGKWCSQQYLGSQAEVPLSEQITQWKRGGPKPIKSIEEIIADFEELSLQQECVIMPDSPGVLFQYNENRAEGFVETDWEFLGLSEEEKKEEIARANFKAPSSFNSM